MQKVQGLMDAMKNLEIEITKVTDILKESYIEASAAMPHDETYFLNGVQTGPVVKSYLLTRRGIDIPGEGTMQIPEFIESVLRFANYPNRKIEVLNDLCSHLEKIYTITQRQ
jgi:hypothetical protein